MPIAGAGDKISVMASDHLPGRAGFAVRHGGAGGVRSMLREPAPRGHLGATEGRPAQAAVWDGAEPSFSESRGKIYGEPPFGAGGQHFSADSVLPVRRWLALVGPDRRQDLLPALPGGAGPGRGRAPRRAHRSAPL